MKYQKALGDPATKSGKDGKEKLYSIDEFEKRFDLFEKEIDKKYVN